jgi:hypothetical protein
LSSAAVSASLSADGVLVVPPLTAGGSPAQVAIGVYGTVDVSHLSFNLGFTLSGQCGNVKCPWQNAFGVPGMIVGDIGGNFGVSFDAVPVPSVSISADNVVLPSAWVSPLGVQPGTSFSLDLNVNADEPLLEISVVGSPVALKPLQIVSSDPSVVSQLQVNQATIVLAPFGGITAAGTTVSAGLSVVFDATFGGVPVHVDASVGLSPLGITATAYLLGRLDEDQQHLLPSVDHPERVRLRPERRLRRTAVGCLTHGQHPRCGRSATRGRLAPTARRRWRALVPVGCV